MKRLGLLVVCIMVIFATSGCGNKKLVCTKEKDTIKEDVTFNFDSEDNFKDGKATMTMEAPEGTTDEEMQKAKEGLEEELKEFDAKIKIKKNKLIINMTITKDNIKEMDIEGEMTYDNILKEAEKDNVYTCKKK